MTSASAVGKQVHEESSKLAKTSSKSEICADGGYREKSLPYDTTEDDELTVRKSKLGLSRTSAYLEGHPEVMCGADSRSRG